MARFKVKADFKPTGSTMHFVQYRQKKQTLTITYQVINTYYSLDNVAYCNKGLDYNVYTHLPIGFTSDYAN